MTLSHLKRRFIFLTLFFLSLGLVLFSEQVLKPFFPDKEQNTQHIVKVQRKAQTPPKKTQVKKSSFKQKKTQSLKDNLTERSLKQAIQEQKGYLYIQRCYASYLQENPHWQGTGQITVNFTADPKGILKDTKVLKSSFAKAESFHKCIATVFDRIKIKPFSGKAVQVNFPLNLF